MVGKKLTEGKRRLAEQFGVLFESWGFPRMAGRIFGWLLVCDPPHQTANDLYEAVGASKGSISTVMRMLEPASMIERLSMPGERATYYRIKDGWWAEMVKRKVEAMALFRQAAEGGLELLAGEGPATRRRLEELRDVYAFFEREFPKIVDRLKKEREGIRKS